MTGGEAAGSGMPFAVTLEPAVHEVVGERADLTVSEPRRRRAVSQAMRAFRRLVESPHGAAEVDEEATAEQAAGDDLWLPVFAPARERLLELDVVIDDGRFAILHRAAANRFAAAFTDVAAFRVIRTHLLDADVERESELRLRTGRADAPATPASALALPGRTGRRLIVVLTDGIGDAWHTGAAHRMLARWGENNAVVVVHLLPARLWRRTGIAPERAELRNTKPAAAAVEYGSAVPPGMVPVPVIGTAAGQVKGWAEFVMGSRARWSCGVLACSSAETDHESREPEEERLGRGAGSGGSAWASRLSPSSWPCTWPPRR
ncbi:hypothetical protein GCM10020219_028430 [Nonomuraea dietziae]